VLGPADRFYFGRSIFNLSRKSRGEYGSLFYTKGRNSNTPLNTNPNFAVEGFFKAYGLHDFKRSG